MEMIMFYALVSWLVNQIMLNSVFMLVCAHLMYKFKYNEFRFLDPSLME